VALGRALAGRFDAVARRPDLAAAALAAFIAAILLPKSLAAQFEHRASVRRDGARLREYAGAGAPVLGLYATEVIYYAGDREVPLPYGHAADVVAAARARGIRFLVVSLRAKDREPPDPRPEAVLAAIGLAPVLRITDLAEGRTYYRLVYEL
ncbi:MAG TPA: hypothetical protein VHF22_04535, partial [Planctomycetota bacterium]|nr:hypothetical protein [Planctomycetota bacterium]